MVKIFTNIFKFKFFEKKLKYEYAPKYKKFTEFFKISSA